MSIRIKILLGCLALTSVTVLLGGYTRAVQRELGGVTTRLYDESFLAMSYLRSAQNGLMRVEAEYQRPWHNAEQEEAARGALAAALPEVSENLGVARTRALSFSGRSTTEGLAGALTALGDLARSEERATLLRALGRIDAQFETAVELYAADAFAQRAEAGAMVERSVRRSGMAMVASVLVALLITAALSGSIVPAVREAVGIAEAIAAGRLDTPIRIRGGRGEAALLMRALGTMQNSIAAAMARIRALMEAQASSHAGEIATQHARFDAALSNMVQGLTMYDGEEVLVVVNRRFAELMGLAPDRIRPGMTFRQVLEALAEIGHFEGLRLDDVHENGRVRIASGVGARFTDDGRCGQILASRHERVPGGGWLSSFEDVTEIHRAEARLVHMARHDALTGLPNRMVFREHLERMLGRARRGGPGPAVLCLDLDRFKPVNDALGHAVGDGLLRAVAARLGDCLRETDVVARVGGDEFVVVQEGGAQMDEASALAARLVGMLSAPFQVEGHQIVVGASIGIALAADGLEEPDALLKRADLALYRAKAEGRGAFRFFEVEMDARMQEQRRLELDLRGAMALDQFELFYQPLVDAASGAVGGFEALLRWRHPERGMVSPAVFIPLAEEIGLIDTIGTWVLRTACAEAATWPAGIRVAVNLSPVQFRDRSLPAVVADALAASGLAPRQLELEITESLLLSDDEAVLAMLHEMRAMGARISMDDFGTGYSSLSYLRRFPFDKIKIDQSFVRGLSEQADCAAIVRAVVGLGRSLGMAVNAEGVETAAQLAALRAEGCGEVQGYLFSRPRPAAEVPAMLTPARPAVAA